MDSDSLSSLFAPANRHSHFFGVTVGIVTNNQDPRKLGRVKVRFPWLSDTTESHWARVLAPMAGPGRGFYALPEVGDEVLVAFEHGVPEFPYVLGALWNGKDKPPAANDDGKNNKRLFKSRSGHLIQFDDTEGNEQIAIIDKSGKNSIVIDTARNSITISSDADIEMNCTRGKLKLSGKSVEIAATADVKIEAGGAMNLQANGLLKLKGALVDIN